MGLRRKRTKPPFAGAAPDASLLGSARQILLAPSDSRLDRHADLSGATVGAQPPVAVLSPRGQTVREAWVAWLSPHFTGNDSAYFTFTYSDDYGFPHGCMKIRNCQKDLRAFLKELGLDDKRFIVGVEQHRYRDILHMHGILEGSFTPGQLNFLKRYWAIDRGHARVLPVLDNCTSYVTKYALKGDSTAFEWNL